MAAVQKSRALVAAEARFEAAKTNLADERAREKGRNEKLRAARVKPPAETTAAAKKAPARPTSRSGTNGKTRSKSKTRDAVEAK